MKADNSKAVANSRAGTAKEVTAVADKCPSETQEVSQEEEELKSTLPRLENQLSPRGGPRMSRVEIRERRLEIWRLHLAGLSEDEIAQQAKIDKSAVSRHLKYVREHDSWIGRGHRDLYAEITREVYDAARLTRQESYKILYDPSNQNRPEIKLGAISRIQVTIRSLIDLRLDLESLAFREELDELKGYIEEKEKQTVKKIDP